MLRNLTLSILFISCFCCTQGQVWTGIIDSVPRTPSHFYTATIDTISNTLFLGGDFHNLNQYITKGVIKFDGTSFDTLESGIDDFAKNYISPSKVRSMQFFQNKLYVFGDFEKTGKYYCNNIIGVFNNLNELLLFENTYQNSRQDQQSHKIRLSNFPEGIYYLEIDMENCSKAHKSFVVKRK